MHILFLTDNFPPEVNAPASRTFEHCREWVKAGHKVTVITTAPNFPTGKVHTGYRNRLAAHETMAGIEVVRVWTYITANEGFLRRSIDYASFMVAAILAAPFVRKVDVVVATSPQFFTTCAGAVVGFLKRAPFVFELRDLWPESIRAVGALKNGFLLGALHRLEMALYRGADAVVCVTNAFRENLMSRGIDGDKIFVVTNGVDLARFEPRVRDEALAARHGLTGRFVAGYIGTHGMAHALGTVLDAAHNLQARPDAADVRFLFLGDGASKKALQAKAEALKLTNVVFVGSVPKDAVPGYWSLLDVSVIHLKKDDLFTAVIPSKLFEGMAMGIPVLHGVAGESAAIVEREGVGVAFEPENAEALADAVLLLAGQPQLRADFRARSLDAAPRYDRSVLAADMLGVLEQTARAGRGARFKRGG